MICKYPECNDEIHTYAKKKTPDLFCKKHCTIQNLITFKIRFGKIEGENRYVKMLEKRRISKTLNGMIEKFGKFDGRNRWDDYCNKQSKRNTLEGKIEKWGKEKGTKKYKEKNIKCGIVVRRDYFLTDAQCNYDLADWLLSERQATFSKEKCIKKYGEEKGLEVWKERQEKWQNTLNSKTQEEKDRMNRKKAITIENFIKKYGEVNGKQKYNEWLKKLIYHSPDSISNISQNFFIELEKQLSIKIQKEQIIGNYIVDGIFNKTVIEFNGDYWHCNPKIYNGEYYHKKMKMFAEQKWQIDDEREKILKELGYDVLIVWENDWIQNKENVIKECYVKLVK